jgi:hypothetical protein
MGSRDHGMVEFGVQIPMAPMSFQPRSAYRQKYWQKLDQQAESSNQPCCTPSLEGNWIEPLSSDITRSKEKFCSKWYFSMSGLNFAPWVLKPFQKRRLNSGSESSARRMRVADQAFRELTLAMLSLLMGDRTWRPGWASLCCPISVGLPIVHDHR